MRHADPADTTQVATPQAEVEVPKMQPADLARGMTRAEVDHSRAEFGTNELPSATSRSMWAILRANVFTLFNLIVLACFTLLAFLGRWQDAIFGFSAIANSIIGVWQESSAKRQLDNLMVLHAPLARVLREGEVEEIAREDLVLGDVIQVRAGDQVPADARVLSAAGLQVDESLLTGEEDAVDKATGAPLLSGAIVVAGHGAALVVRVGADSFAAKLTAEAKRFSLVNSEIRNGLNKVLRIVAFLLLPVMLIAVNGQMNAFGGWGVALGNDAWRDAAVGAVAAAIAMVPLGLLLMTSVAFAAGALKLGRRKVLVQELHAVEGLARVDMLCFDKTGTLTEGGVAYWDTHPTADPQPGWDEALAAIAADDGANDSAACLAEAYPATLAARISEQIPFSSQRKWSAISVAAGTATGTWIFGAPDIILQRGKDDELLERVNELSNEGRRVIAMCYSPTVLDAAAAKSEQLPSDRIGTLAVSLRERIRTDAADTVRYFREEGVDLRVISGDDPRTVAAVAREVGLIEADDDGFDARTLPEDPEALAEVLEHERVFGRVTPTQKKAMVQALQSRGHVVAMTGDGVNDVLALKEADLGIAMGHGSAAARAVSRLTLLDNQFQAMPDVVREGRQAIANVERVSMLYLSKTAYAILFAVIFGALLWQYPFLPRQMSILDGFTIGWPAFVLALLPNNRRYVTGFFRRAVSFAVPAGVIVALGIVSVAIVGRLTAATIQEQQTAASFVLAILGLWILSLVCRPFAPVLIAVLIGAITVFFLTLIVPFARWFLEYTWPTTELWWTIGIAGVVGVILLEIHGRMHARRTGRELADSSARTQERRQRIAARRRK
ncbi:HAD family hydrolase [Gulosibacter macacae]|uniref:HAD family hydrolase n=1 Tax=Gulosibacter macacae TaxID=2488791 RepID=A0A3P3VZ23_9MICO|nr:HAD-IC family P-type ATPase [Gulosibacter macacae]RRJ87960.1 HAD family hydrolase [Gulosibacter macacae]